VLAPSNLEDSLCRQRIAAGQSHHGRLPLQVAMSSNSATGNGAVGVTLIVTVAGIAIGSCHVLPQIKEAVPTTGIGRVKDVHGPT